MRATARLTLRVHRAANAACQARDADLDARRGTRRNFPNEVIKRLQSRGSLDTTDAFIVSNWVLFLKRARRRSGQVESATGVIVIGGGAADRNSAGRNIDCASDVAPDGRTIFAAAGLHLRHRGRVCGILTDLKIAANPQAPINVCSCWRSILQHNLVHLVYLGYRAASWRHRRWRTRSSSRSRGAGGPNACAA